MADFLQETSSASTHSSPSTRTQSSSTRRHIASCLTCRKRKVKCDHQQPVCSACRRGNHTCTYINPPEHPSQKVAKPKRAGQSSEIYARLDKLESLLAQAIGAKEKAGGRGAAVQPRPLTTESSGEPTDQVEGGESVLQWGSTRSDVPAQASEGSALGGFVADGASGMLLLEGGESRFVSSVHWSLLSDELHDIKTMLAADQPENPIQNPGVFESVLLNHSPQSPPNYEELPLLDSPEHRRHLLDRYFSNIDPMTRVLHRPSFTQQFDSLIAANHPLAYAVCYCAVFSMDPSDVVLTFSTSRDELLVWYSKALDASLTKEGLLTTSSLQVLQAFLLYATVQVREDDNGKVWTLLGSVHRIAISQGLHRDPSLFPLGSMDEVTVELRRRLWYQILHLDCRSAEGRGQEPVILDENFTTLLPRNVEDEELIAGRYNNDYQMDTGKYTAITQQLVRYSYFGCFRKIIQRSYVMERRLASGSSHDTASFDPVLETQAFVKAAFKIVQDTLTGVYKNYVRYCSTRAPLERYAGALAQLAGRRSQVRIWNRVPRRYQDVAFTPEQRVHIFESACITMESLNQAYLERDASPFRWHIASHTGFESVMHVLTELRKDPSVPSASSPPASQSPQPSPYAYPPHLRMRAINALLVTRHLHRHNPRRLWQVMRRLVNRTLQEAGYRSEYEVNRRTREALVSMGRFGERLHEAVVGQDGSFERLAAREVEALDRVIRMREGSVSASGGRVDDGSSRFGVFEGIWDAVDTEERPANATGERNQEESVSVGESAMVMPVTSPDTSVGQQEIGREIARDLEADFGAATGGTMDLGAAEFDNWPVIGEPQLELGMAMDGGTAGDGLLSNFDWGFWNLDPAEFASQQ